VGHTGRERAHVAEMAGIIEARQRLDSQQSENELVLKVRPTYAIGRPVQLDSCRTRSRQEFAQLKSHNTVFKLIGPSLVPHAYVLDDRWCMVKRSRLPAKCRFWWASRRVQGAL